MSNSPRGQCYKTFYGRNLRNFVTSYSVCPGKPFQLSLMFAGNARAYPSEALFRCSTLWQTPGLTHKLQTRLERFARDNHTSLLQKFINYDRKMFYNIGPRQRGYVRGCCCGTRFVKQKSSIHRMFIGSQFTFWLLNQWCYNQVLNRYILNFSIVSEAIFQ